MPIDTYWDNEEHTIIRADVTGLWTMDEANASRAKMFEMFDSVHHRVDVIWHWADAESRNQAPRGIVNLLAAMARTPHHRRGMIVFVPKRQDFVARLWADVITKAFPRLRRDTIGVNTLEEAHDLLKAQVRF